jgi:hypothetical protein
MSDPLGEEREHYSYKRKYVDTIMAANNQLLFKLSLIPAIISGCAWPLPQKVCRVEGNHAD